MAIGSGFAVKDHGVEGKAGKVPAGHIRVTVLTLDSISDGAEKYAPRGARE